MPALKTILVLFLTLEWRANARIMTRNLSVAEAGFIDQ
jgi:hypothetical protein